jgi:hypothetical protein
MAEKGIDNTSETTNGDSNQAEEDKRYCWVCFASDDDDDTVPWVRPCNCRGTTKWVCWQRKKIFSSYHMHSYVANLIVC